MNRTYLLHISGYASWEYMMPDDREILGYDLLSMLESPATSFSLGTPECITIGDF